MTNSTATAVRFPALTGEPVTELHARICREKGHAAHTVDGVDTGVCPRCGEVPASACYACEWDLRSHQHTCGK